MGFFDLATLGGFAAGLATGHVLQAALGVEIGISFTIAVIIVVISLIMVYYLVDETLNPEELAKAQENEIKNSEFLTRVLHVVRTNKDLQKILPVYVPMISLYGLLVAYAKELAEDELGAGISPDLILVAIILGSTMGVSMLLSGKLSDTKLVRRPFIIIGLISLAILIILFRLFSVEAGGEGSFTSLLAYWPATALLGFGVGMFPPAILAYLTDISRKDTRGTMFGVYSVIFGSGMIIGPLLGSFFAEIGRIYDAEIWGLVIAVVLLVLLSSIGTLFIDEKAKESIELKV